jgi:porphobilinogen synthase
MRPPALPVDFAFMPDGLPSQRSALRRRPVRQGLQPEHLIWPLFVQDGQDRITTITSMPGCARFSLDHVTLRAQEAVRGGLAGIALFPVIPDHLKDRRGREGVNPEGLMVRAIQAVKAAAPELLILADVALDPYSSDGHDGVVMEGRIVNDETLPILVDMACLYGQAGADLVAPSDMMDGRVGVIRRALDQAGLSRVGICSYAVKYASSFYGPFREALSSAPRFGDKRTYQMDPANIREARREVRLDEAEGADWIMVKPGLPYLDVVSVVRAETVRPVAVYQVSGEYAMLKAGAGTGAFDFKAVLLEALSAMRRAGADLIVTYGALEAARWLQESTMRSEINLPPVEP